MKLFYNWTWKESSLPKPSSTAGGCSWEQQLHVGQWCSPERMGGLQMMSLMRLCTSGVRPARSTLTVRPAASAWHRWVPITARGRDLLSLMALWGNKGTGHAQGSGVSAKKQSRVASTWQQYKTPQNTALLLISISFLIQLVKCVSPSKLHSLSATPHLELSWDEGAVVHLTSQGPTNTTTNFPSFSHVGWILLLKHLPWSKASWTWLTQTWFS